MARITYDTDTAAAFKAVREIPRDGLSEWREALLRHLAPTPGMTLVDVGAGTGQFAAAFADWFDIEVVAVEPSAAMRAQIAPAPRIRTLAGDACALPMPDASADAAWLSLVIHHIPDLAAAARELRRVLRPGAPVLVRQGFPDRNGMLARPKQHRIEVVRWFPETVLTLNTFPSLAETRTVFAAAGFHRVAVEQVREAGTGSLSELLDQVDTLRHADTTMRSLTEQEFLRGKERLRRAVRREANGGPPEPRGNLLDLLVLR